MDITDGKRCGASYNPQSLNSRRQSDMRARLLLALPIAVLASCNSPETVQPAANTVDTTANEAAKVAAGL